MSIRNAIDTYCNIERSLEERNASYDTILKAFLNHQCTFLTFVDECTELNSDDAGRRRRAINLFGKLLTDPQLPSNPDTAIVFFDFFSKRLGDLMITGEVLNVMIAIDKTYHDTILASAKSFITSINTDIKIGTLKYSSRKLVYELLLSLLPSSSLLSETDTICQNILSIVDGEKDPRGVVQVCSIIQQVFERFSSQLTPNTLNDLFMLINGYFPVTYITPPLVAGNRDVVTSEDVCTAVANTLTATPLTTPLLLPYLETALRDSSPNSKTQGAGVLRRLCEKWGWSEQMCSGCVMTEGEKQRWIELVIEEYVGSSSSTPEETHLLHVIEVMAASKESFWRNSLQEKAVANIIKSPVSPSNLHWAQILRQTTRADPSLYKAFVDHFLGLIQECQNTDILDGLIAILSTVIVAHHSQPSDELVQYLPYFVQSLNRISSSSHQLPNENSYLLLCVLELDKEGTLSNQEELFIWLMKAQVNDEDLKYALSIILMTHGHSVCEALMNGDLNTRTPILILEEVLKSPYQSLLVNTLQQQLTSKGVSSHLTEIGTKIVHLITSEGVEECMSDSMLDLIVVSFETMKEKKRLVIENLFCVLKKFSISIQSTLLDRLTPHLPFLETFDKLTHIHSENELITCIDQSPLCEYLIRFVFLFDQTHSQIIINHYLPLINTIPCDSEDDFGEWVSQHPFFTLMNRNEVFAVFTEYIRTQTEIEPSRCCSLQTWSLLSLLHEFHIPEPLLRSYIRFVGTNFTPISLSDTMIESLVNRLLSITSSCEGFQLIFHILHLTQHSESLRLRCIVIALQRDQAIEETLKELHLLFTQNPTMVVSDLDTLLLLLEEKLSMDQPVFRILILRLFQDFANLPLSTVFSYAPKVVRALEPSLDDPQRVIREMAARVRNLWLMIHFLVCLNKHITLVNSEKWMKYRKH